MHSTSWSVDPERLARIQDKLLHAEDRLGHFQQWSADARNHLKDRLASFKAIQEAAEAMADAAAMVLKERGVPPHDDYTNFEALRDLGAVTAGMAADLAELNGLRNAIVHEYDGLSDERALTAGERLAPAAQGIIEGVRAWLSKNA